MKWSGGPIFHASITKRDPNQCPSRFTNSDRVTLTLSLPWETPSLLAPVPWLTTSFRWIQILINQPLLDKHFPTGIQISIEYRGVVFSIGGDLSWREILTLPNILKEFNPRLYGYSVGSKKFNSDEPTALNFAEYGATAEDMTKQAYKLIHRLKCDRHVDFKRHWKMVTILVGHNDICAHSCGMRPPFGPGLVLSHWCQRAQMTPFIPILEKDGSPKVYLKNMAKVLDVLHRELPRTFVNLLPIANVGKLLDIFEKPLPCQITHPYGCPCLFGGQNTLSRSKIQYLLNEYLQGLENLVNSGRYDTRSDFTVVIQPNLVQGDVPQHRPDRFARLQPNLDYLAPDCFHWAQKTHAKCELTHVF